MTRSKSLIFVYAGKWTNIAYVWYVMGLQVYFNVKSTSNLFRIVSSQRYVMKKMKDLSQFDLHHTFFIEVYDDTDKGASWGAQETSCWSLGWKKLKWNQRIYSRDGFKTTCEKVFISHSSRSCVSFYKLGVSHFSFVVVEITFFFCKTFYEQLEIH